MYHLFQVYKMNLFILSWNVRECAEFMFDKHVVKIILEAVQMLCTTVQIKILVCQGQLIIQAHFLLHPIQILPIDLRLMI